MVGDGEVLVVGLQGVVGPTEEHAYVVGVVQAGIEVGVITDLEWNMVGDFRQRQQSGLLQRGVVF